jgi:hypothetical protein
MKLQMNLSTELMSPRWRSHHFVSLPFEDVPANWEPTRLNLDREGRRFNRVWVEAVFLEFVAIYCHFLPRPENGGKVRKLEWPLCLRRVIPPPNLRGTRRLQNVANSVGKNSLRFSDQLVCSAIGELFTEGIDRRRTVLFWILDCIRTNRRTVARRGSFRNEPNRHQVAGLT